MSIKKILVSQQIPHNLAPYTALSEKHGIEFEFKPFFTIEPLSSREFRAQRIDILSYTAVVFNSRHAIDAFFQLCNELRVKVPETMKYFCSSEAVAMYLQKHIVYRKRKIFFGTSTPESVAALITDKHSKENFLVTTMENSSGASLTRLLDVKGVSYKVGVFVKSVPQDLSGVNLHDYDMVVLYNPNDVKSIYNSHPDFKQDDLKFATYGKSIVKAMDESGLAIELKAPTPECPSVVMALENYLKNSD